jgi:para-nitrobenzyl esterase
MSSGVGPSFGSPLALKGRGFPWGPLVDGKVVPHAPADVGVKVPSLFGSTEKEGMIFVLATYSSNLTTQTQETYNTFLEYQFGSLASRVNSTYPLSKFPQSASSPNPVDAAIGTIFTDYAYRCTAHRALQKGVSNGVPVYTYLFSHAPSCTWISALPDRPFVHSFVGATHTSELPFVFGVLDGLPAPGGNCSSTAAESQLSQSMISSWNNMAASRNPGANWPRWLPGNGRGKGLGVNYLQNATTQGVVDYSSCGFWNEIRDELLSMRARGIYSGP